MSILKCGIDHEFARQTILLNKLLVKFRLRICKDCQKLTSSKELRCRKCDLLHKEYLYEKISSDLQYEEEHDYYDEDHEDFSNDLD